MTDDIHTTDDLEVTDPDAYYGTKQKHYYVAGEETALCGHPSTATMSRVPIAENAHPTNDYYGVCKNCEQALLADKFGYVSDDERWNTVAEADEHQRITITLANGDELDGVVTSEADASSTYRFLSVDVDPDNDTGLDDEWRVKAQEGDVTTELSFGADDREEYTIESIDLGEMYDYSDAVDEDPADRREVIEQTEQAAASHYRRAEEVEDDLATIHYESLASKLSNVAYLLRSYEAKTIRKVRQRYERIAENIAESDDPRDDEEDAKLRGKSHGVDLVLNIIENVTEEDDPDDAEPEAVADGGRVEAEEDSHDFEMPEDADPADIEYPAADAIESADTATLGYWSKRADDLIEVELAIDWVEAASDDSALRFRGTPETRENQLETDFRGVFSISEVRTTRIGDLRYIDFEGGDEVATDGGRDAEDEEAEREAAEALVEMAEAGKIEAPDRVHVKTTGADTRPLAFEAMPVTVTTVGRPSITVELYEDEFCDVADALDGELVTLEAHRDPTQGGYVFATATRYSPDAELEQDLGHLVGFEAVEREEEAATDGGSLDSRERAETDDTDDLPDEDAPIVLVVDGLGGRRRRYEGTLAHASYVESRVYEDPDDDSGRMKPGVAGYVDTDEMRLSFNTANKSVYEHRPEEARAEDAVIDRGTLVAIEDPRVGGEDDE